MAEKTLSHIVDSMECKQLNENLDICVPNNIKKNGNLYQELILHLANMAIENSHEILYRIFNMLYEIMNDVHVTIACKIIIDIFSPSNKDSHNFVNELSLKNTIEFEIICQSSNLMALAQKLIIQAKNSLAYLVEKFFDQIMMADYMDKKYDAYHKMRSLLYTLNATEPNIFYIILDQLKYKVKSIYKKEKLRAIKLAWAVLSEKDYVWSDIHASLFNALLDRFNDTTNTIRIKSIQSVMQCLVNQNHLRNDIIECLIICQEDSDDNVRYELVMAIIDITKHEFNIIVSELMILIHILSKRTSDKNIKIRTGASRGLAFIYKKATSYNNKNANIKDEMKKSLTWIPNNILFAYNLPSTEDRIALERLLITYLIPYKLCTEARMKKLYNIWINLNGNATKSFLKMHVNQIKSRQIVREWIQLKHCTKLLSHKLQNKLNKNQSIIYKFFPKSLKAPEFLKKFYNNLRKNPQLLKCVEKILKPNASCKEFIKTSNLLLVKKQDKSNLYYHAIKVLFGRIGTSMIDKESIEILVRLIDDCFQARTTIINELNLPVKECGEKGLQLLYELSSIYPIHFFNDNTLNHMITLLRYDNECITIFILKSITRLGHYMPLSKKYCHIFNYLANICKNFALTGTVKEAKNAIRCIFVNAQSNKNKNMPIIEHPIFGEIIENLTKTLEFDYEHQYTKLVTLGQIAYYMPRAFRVPIKSMISKRIVKGLLLRQKEPPRVRNYIMPINVWCDKENLPYETLYYLQGLKVVARWLIGLYYNERAAQKTFRLLSIFITQVGDILNQNRLNTVEKAWLRLTAGCALLKVCREYDVDNQYTPVQYYTLSRMMRDPVPEVREIFARKLHEGLNKGFPHQCLPIKFIAYYVLAGFETDERLLNQVRSYIEKDINKRRAYIKMLNNIIPNSPDHDEFIRMSPDFLITYIITVLAHDASFIYPQNDVAPASLEKCLRLVLQPLLAKPDIYSYAIYKHLLTIMKEQYANSQESSIMDSILWSVIHLSENIIEIYIDGLLV